MFLVERAKGVLFEPSKFFKRNKDSFLQVLFYFAVFFFFSAVLQGVFGFFLDPYAQELLKRFIPDYRVEPVGTPFDLALATALGYVVGFLLQFVSAALLHVYILLFGGLGDYENTYRLLVYSQTPMFLFGWFPIVSFLAFFYSAYLCVLGSVQLHKLSLKKAKLMFFIPAALYALVVAGIIGYVAYSGFA